MKNTFLTIATLSIIIFSAEFPRADDYQSTRPTQNAPVAQGWSWQSDGLALQDPNLFPTYTCQPVGMQGTDPNASVTCECTALGATSYSYSVPVSPQSGGYNQTYLENICQISRPR